MARSCRLAPVRHASGSTGLHIMDNRGCVLPVVQWTERAPPESGIGQSVTKAQAEWSQIRRTLGRLTPSWQRRAKSAQAPRVWPKGVETRRLRPTGAKRPGSRHSPDHARTKVAAAKAEVVRSAKYRFDSCRGDHTVLPSRSQQPRIEPRHIEASTNKPSHPGAAHEQ